MHDLDAVEATLRDNGAKGIIGSIRNTILVEWERHGPKHFSVHRIHANGVIGGGHYFACYIDASNDLHRVDLNDYPYPANHGE